MVLDLEQDILKALSRNIFPTATVTLRSGPSKMGDIATESSSQPCKAQSLPEHVSKNGALEEILDAKCFDGRQKVFKHYSQETNCFMKFSIYVPDNVHPDEKFYTVFFLSGIMCNEQNFLFRSAFQKYASEQKLIVVGADTSPRGCDIPGDRDVPIFGRSAGWYLDATEEPWNNNYRMYSYISKELPEIIKKHFPTTGKFGLIGHSMGGNGTIVIGLRNPNVFQSLSLLAPSCNPTCWAQELIYRKFLGDDESLWHTYDACRVTEAYDGPFRNILLDQGAEDEYLKFLLPGRLQEIAELNPRDNVKINLEMHDGYDHSYHFVASFIEKHLKFHKDMLNK